jgi:two-component system, chemotaxis family, protein-glutamate methylesterase/glutaminase
MKPVTVLVVDDSATMRSLISAVLRRDPGIEVIGSAGDPLEAREAIKALNPDVVTLDIEMPNMDGLAFLERIMRLRPMPVVMVSTLTQRGADATLTALELGAFDCVAKPAAGAVDGGGFSELPEKVKAAARSRVRPFGKPATPLPETSSYSPGRRVVAIGSSTGGVEALTSIISRFPAKCPPTVITQHMPATFTKSFAERLNRVSAATVLEATDGASVEAGRVYIAPGGARHLEISGTGVLRCRLREAEPVNGHRPSVDVLFDSAAKVLGADVVGVILTGMGRDGARGLLSIREGGGHTLGQDEHSSVVYGMPRVAFEMGAVERQLSLDRMASAILSMCNSETSEAA